MRRRPMAPARSGGPAPASGRGKPSRSLSKTLWISAEACPAYPAMAENLSRAAVPATGPPATGPQVNGLPAHGLPVNELVAPAFPARQPRERRRAAPVSVRGDPAAQIRRQRPPPVPMAQQARVGLPARGRFGARPPVPRLFRLRLLLDAQAQVLPPPQPHGAAFARRGRRGNPPAIVPSSGNRSRCRTSATARIRPRPRRTRSATADGRSDISRRGARP